MVGTVGKEIFPKEKCFSRWGGGGRDLRLQLVGCQVSALTGVLGCL